MTYSIYPAYPFNRRAENSNVLTVTTPATNTNLTNLAAVKDQLSISGTSEDTFLNTQIARASAAVCAYLNVPTALDGTRNLGTEVLTETFRLQRCQTELLLSRYPVRSIASVVENTVTLATTEYEARDGGVLARLTTDDCQWHWPYGKIVVQYTAGWKVPDDTGRTLPQDIEDATIGLVKAYRFNRTRDPLLRSESILERLYEYQLFAPSDKVGVFPADVAALLAPYRNIAI